MRLKKLLVWLLSYLSRWLWRLVVWFAIFLALVVSAGREMAPLLREHKAWLETHLTASTGEIITMHDVNAYWEGLTPELAIKQLKAGNSLQADSALIRVDLLGSVKARALVFDTFDLDQTSVKIPVGSPDASESFDLRAYLELLFGSADIHVRNLDITLVQNAGLTQPAKQLPLHVDELTIQNDGDTHWLNSSITVGEKNSVDKKVPIQLVMRFNGDAGDIFSGKGRAHIQLGDDKNLVLFQQFLYHMPNNPAFSYVAKLEKVNGQIWASWSNQRIDWFSDTSVKGLVFDGATYTLDFSGKLAGHVLTEAMSSREYFIYTLPDQGIVLNRKSYTLPVMGLQYATRDSLNDLSVYLPELQLPELMRYVNLLPSRELQDVLKKLKPSGSLSNFLVTLPLQGAAVNDTDNIAHQKSGWRVRANLDKVSVSAWEGAPALSSLDGYLDASMSSGMYSGFVDVNSREGFSMHFPALYRQSMNYDRALGRVNWSFEPATQHVYVGSSDLDFHGDDGELRGAFWLNLPSSQSAQNPELYLAASLTDTDVRFRNKYLPYNLNPSLKDWLARSIKAGNMDESGFIYRGTLSQNDPQEKTLTFFSKVRSARLMFDPEWPVVSDMEGLLLVNNESVHAKIKNGNLLGFKFNNANVEIKPSVNNQAHFLTLQTDVSGPGNDVLRVMRETSLKKTFGGVFDGWRLDGDATGHVNVGIGIGSAQEQDFQEFDFHLNGNDLLVGGVNLPLEKLQGDAHYSSTAGLSAPHMDAILWGQKQVITITPQPHGDGLPDIVASMAGDIDPQAAAPWAHLPFIHFLQGNIPMEGTLTVPLNTNTEQVPVVSMVAHSDMKGVVVDLPQPFKKTADELLSTTVNVDLWKDKQQYRVEYGPLISASVEQKAVGGLRGDIVINQQDNPATELPGYLRVRATIDQALLSDWMPVMDRNTAFTKADAEKYKKNNQGQPVSVGSADYPVFDLFIRQLTIGSLKLDDMKLAADYQQDASHGNYWKIAFDNAMMTGRYHYFDDIKHIPEIEFDTVKVGEADPKSGQGQQAVEADDSKRIDPLADVIPQNLPAMQVHAKQVILKGDDVGDWRYVLKPNKQGVVLDDMYVAMPGLTMKGMENDHGATVNWYRDGNNVSTEVSSRFGLSNQNGVKNLFGVERIIEAEKTDIQGVVKWQGSPAMISFRRLQGDLSVLSEKGRFLNSTASTDLMRVINVFNFSTWARRLKLDFADLYKKGVSFDKVSADINLDKGKVTFDKPLIMEGPSGRFELKGDIDSVLNTVDASLIVTIPVNQNATWIAALAAGLPVAAGVWVVSKIFGDQIDKLSSVNYMISGSLDDPNVKFVSLLPELEKNNSSKAKDTTKPTNETPGTVH